MKIEWGKFLANFVGVGVIGFCIGWLLGMAVSPVIANVITTIIGAAATLVAIMGGCHKRVKSSAGQPYTKPKELIQYMLQRLTHQLRAVIHSDYCPYNHC